MTSEQKKHSSVRRLAVLAIIIAALLVISKIIPQQSQTLRINADTQSMGMQNIRCTFSDKSIACKNGVNINYIENYIEVTVRGIKAGDTRLSVEILPKSNKNDAKIQSKSEYNIKVNSLHMVTIEEIK